MLFLRRGDARGSTRNGWLDSRHSFSFGDYYDPEHMGFRALRVLNEDRIAVNGARILILGVAYKANVSDMRESPALDVIRLLAERGGEVSYHDPHVGEVEVEGVAYKSAELTDEALANTDVAVILTDHGDVDYARVVARAARVFDTRNATRDVPGARGRVRKL